MPLQKTELVTQSSECVRTINAFYDLFLHLFHRISDECIWLMIMKSNRNIVSVSDAQQDEY